MSSSLQQAWNKAKEVLKEHAHHEADLDATLLLCQVLDKPRSYLYTWPETLLTSSQQQTYERLIQSRARGVPLAYITGEQAFWSMTLHVTPDTLIPRSETELVVECALSHLTATDTSAQIADLGTGSGAIALALSHERPNLHIDATDRSRSALEIARGNAQRFGCQQIDFYMGNWCQALPKQRRYHIIVSNPPYIALGDTHLSQGDLPWEPITALASGPDGLQDIRHIVKQAPEHLKAGGWLIFEHGYQQAEMAQEYLRCAGLTEISTHSDLAGHPRVTEGRLPVD
jgi:release factor glutamine methyltransferase